jgi:methionine-S-sulfoxide reductase
MIPSNRRKSPGLCCLGFAWFSAFAAYMVGTTCAASTSAPLERATFAGGCFWCEEATFEGIPGVISVISGFSGGREKDPTYDWVSSGRTGHAESVDIVFDPRRITYAKLLDIYWHNISPSVARQSSRSWRSRSRAG